MCTEIRKYVFSLLDFHFALWINRVKCKEKNIVKNQKD